MLRNRRGLEFEHERGGSARAVNMSWPHKSWACKGSTSYFESCKSSDSFNLNASWKFKLVFCYPGCKVRIYRCFVCRVLWCSGLFSSVRSKIFVLFRVWNFRMVLKYNPCFWKILHFSYLLEWWGLQLAPAHGNRTRVGDDVMTRRDYTKVECMKTWLLNSSVANVPTVLTWMPIFKFSSFFPCCLLCLFPIC